MAGSSTEDLARRFYDEFWTRGNAGAAKELIAEDLIHDQFPDGWPGGRAGFERLVSTWRQGFPDMRETILLLLSDRDWVVGRFRLTGTHLGPFYGIPATGRTVDIEGVDLLRFEEGRVAEWIYYEDTFGVFAQLGVAAPVPGEMAGPLVRPR